MEIVNRETSINRVFDNSRTHETVLFAKCIWLVEFAAVKIENVQKLEIDKKTRFSWSPTALIIEMSNQSGIATLLKAEKDAHTIVSQARAYRTTRLKAAKTDAAAEIAAYKQKKEAELKQYEAEHSGLNETADKEAEVEVQHELEFIQKTASEKKSDVVKLLIDAVTNPTPELHINAA